MAFVANLVGALVVGYLVANVQNYPAQTRAVTLFDAASFQHSPANMAYFSLAAGAGMGPGWGTALGWSIVPAALGNLLGGFLLVALPLWITFGAKHSAMSEEGGPGSSS